MRRFHALDLESFAKCGYTLVSVGLLAGAVIARALEIRQTRLSVSGDNTFVVSEDYLVRCLGNYVRITGVFPPPPGASTTNVGTAYPEVCPLRPSMISIPLATDVLKCSIPTDRSQM